MSGVCPPAMNLSQGFNDWRFSRMDEESVTPWVGICKHGIWNRERSIFMRLVVALNLQHKSRSAHRSFPGPVYPHTAVVVGLGGGCLVDSC